MAVPLWYEAAFDAREYVKGRVLYRGQLVVVQDLRVRFGYDASASGVMVVLDDEQGVRYGFIVDDVLLSMQIRQDKYSMYEPRPTGTLLDAHIVKWLELRHVEVCPTGFHLLDVASLC
jgi:chemotaxis signal transduction protein